MSKKVSIGVVGCGYWGPNLMRNFAGNPRSRVGWLVNRDAERLRRFAEGYPQARRTTDLAEAHQDPDRKKRTA